MAEELLALVLTRAYLAVAPFDRVPDLAWGAVVLVTFAGAALAQTVLGRRMRLGDDGPPPELDHAGDPAADDGPSEEDAA